MKEDAFQNERLHKKLNSSNDSKFKDLYTTKVKECENLSFENQMLKRRVKHLEETDSKKWDQFKKGNDELLKKMDDLRKDLVSKNNEIIKLKQDLSIVKSNNYNSVDIRKERTKSSEISYSKKIMDIKASSNEVKVELKVSPKVIKTIEISKDIISEKSQPNSKKEESDPLSTSNGNFDNSNKRLFNSKEINTISEKPLNIEKEQNKKFETIQFQDIKINNLAISKIDKKEPVNYDLLSVKVNSNIPETKFENKASTIQNNYTDNLIVSSHENASVKEKINWSKEASSLQPKLDNALPSDINKKNEKKIPSKKTHNPFELFISK